MYLYLVDIYLPLMICNSRFLSQVCILIDFTQNTSILDNKQISTYLVFPIFVSSAVNPWVYGYRNSELRAAMQKVINDVIAFINCKTTHHYQCPELLVTGEREPVEQ
jgi:hypothetical protein